MLLPILERAARAIAVRRGVASREVATSRGPLHVYDAPGAGPLPTVVLLHGLASSGVQLLPLMGEMRRRARRVIVPEAPGHGFSDKPSSRLTPAELEATMTELLDGLLDEPAVVFGNSLGGAVALRYALRRPERVRSLVLASPAGARMSADGWADVRSAFKARSLVETNRFVDRLYHRPPPVTRLLLPDVRRALRRPAVLELFESARDDDFFSPDELNTLVPPTLLIWGRSERLLPAEALAWWRAHAPPTMRIDEPEGLAHCPHVDDPRRLADAIVSFATPHAGA
jgi:pimeloyl-ACP methyl ester carboxylesterase